MRICLDCSSATLGAELRSMIEDAGHIVTDEVHDALVLLIDDGFSDLFARLARARAVQPAIEPVLVVHAESPKDVPNIVKDFVVAPVGAAELLARLRRIAMRRTDAGTRYEDLLAMAVDATGDVIEITDPESRLQYVNPAFENVLGIATEDAIGKTPAELFRSSQHSPEYFQQIEDTLASGEVWKGMLISQRPDDKLVYLESVIAPVYDVAGRETHRIAVKRDITASKLGEAELRRSNDALSQARDAAIEASRIKSQFVANMSHELRTPLNAILGYAEMLEEEIDELEPEEVVEDVTRIRKAGLHLLSLVNDVLDMSKIEAGHTEIHLEVLELEPLLAAVAQTMDTLVNDKRNELRVDMQCASSTVRSDLVKLRQCVLNLVSNANKFTEQGEITIRAVDVDPPEGKEGEWIEISVSDTGIGMTKEELNRLFQPFMQADASTTRRFGGTGLGLHISQRFCEMLGGSIRVESEAGVGSTFTMTLPSWVDDVTEKAPSRPSSESSAPRTLGDLRSRVLLIDDDRNQHELISRELEALGYDLQAFEHGEQGLRFLRVDQPDLILLDVMLPGMDGWGVLDAIKAEGLGADVPIVMISSSDARGKALEAGAVDFLLKPVTRRELALVLQKWCPTRSARVLVLDADDEDRKVVSDALLKAGNMVNAVEDIASAERCLREQEVHLMLIDTSTKGIDALGFLEKLRGIGDWQRLPVVVSTRGVTDRDALARLEHLSTVVVSRDAYSDAELVDVVGRELERAAERSST